MRVFLCSDGTFVNLNCGDGHPDLHIWYNLIRLQHTDTQVYVKTGKIQVNSILPKSISGYDNLLWWSKTLLSTMKGKKEHTEPFL